MPYVTEWVEPDLFIVVNGVRVYRSYKDNDYLKELDYWFQVQLKDNSEGTTEDDMHEFDVRSLATWEVPCTVVDGRARFVGDPIKAIRASIETGGREALLV